jgi:hypothetical protein
MRLWDALLRTMITARMPRIGRQEAERLLAGEPTDPGHRRLADLLSAVSAPADASEFGGEPLILAAFARASQEANRETSREASRDASRHSPPVATRGRGVLRSRLGRLTIVKAVAGVAVLAVGGTALAAETGSLPAGVQQHAHDLFAPLGVPAPTAGSAQPSDPSRPTTGRSPLPDQASGTPSGPARAAALDLCRAWDAAQRDPHRRALAAEELKALIAAAGGPPSVPTFCARLLAEDNASSGPSPASEPAGPGRGEPGQPGNGNGNGKGNGNGPGKPSSNPHR